MENTFQPICIMIVTPAQTEIDVKTSIKEKAERN